MNSKHTMTKRAAMIAGALALTTVTNTGLVQAAPADHHSSPTTVTAGSCDSGPGYPDPSANLGKPYSREYGSSYLRHAQKRISDKAWAEIETNNPGMKIWLENEDGKTCGPVKVKRGAGGNSRYYASISYLNNAGHSVRACMKHPDAGTLCGKAKTEDSDGES